MELGVPHRGLSPEYCLHMGQKPAFVETRLYLQLDERV